ncbi:glucuronate isomerase [Shewanella sp. 10N.286.48.A6]|uniref:glucuronate isomerase n=1 Tax=Shewanella sp. 10N.286.48.A6 TaxID=1880833 RepID=UPI0039A75705
MSITSQVMRVIMKSFKSGVRPCRILSAIRCISGVTLELKKYFGLDLLLNSENCAVIWQHCNQKLSQESHRFQSLLKESRVDTLCTTDDPLSDLSYHDKLNRSEFSVQVLPTFRADSLIEIENQSNFQNTLNSLAFITDNNCRRFRKLRSSNHVSCGLFCTA